jgi:Integral membrane protein, interacts with FtsH
MNTYENYPNADSNRFLSKVYVWMFIGLMLTAVASYAVMSSPSLLNLFLGSTAVIFGLLIFQLIIVIVLSWAIKSLPPAIATLVFIFYSVLSGITLTPILLFYEMGSVYIAFVIAAGMFIAMSLVGYFIKRDLSGVGRFLIMALIGLILASIVNMILYMISPTTASVMTFFLSIAGVLIFAGLTAYDTQKIKKIGASVDHGDPFTQNLVIVCALTLYLDFINMFLYLLRLFGNRR